MLEEIIHFGPNQDLVGVYAPASSDISRSMPTIIYLNSGVIHHIGTNRMHVTFARALAQTGFAGLRMDFSGVGDSPRSKVMDDGNLEARWMGEISDCMDQLQKQFETEHFILFGNCWGARLAMQMGHDERVVGIIPTNLEPDGGRKAYLTNLALKSDILWRKLRKKPSLLTNMLGGKNEQPEVEDFEAEGTLRNRDILTQVCRHETLKSLLIHSQWDSGRLWAQTILKNTQLSPTFKHVVLPDMDHEVSLISGQKALLSLLSQWLNENFAKVEVAA